MADKKTFDIFIPKDPYDKAKKQTLYAAVNGEGYYFERGKTHKVSKPFYDVISSSLTAQAKVDERIAEIENIKM